MNDATITYKEICTEKNKYKKGIKKLLILVQVLDLIQILSFTLNGFYNAIRVTVVYSRIRLGPSYLSRDARR